MTHHPVLPFGVLLLAICAVTWLRNVLAGHAMFRPQNSSFSPFERIARGFQIAMIVLFVVGSVATGWNIGPVFLPQIDEPRMQESTHDMIQTEHPPTAIGSDDPLWLQREKQHDMQAWEAATWLRYKRPN